jgi:hypothetical protein
VDPHPHRTSTSPITFEPMQCLCGIAAARRKAITLVPGQANWSPRRLQPPQPFQQAQSQRMCVCRFVVVLSGRHSRPEFRSIG